MSVAILRDKTAEKRAKEKAEAPTVKTEEQMKAAEAAKKQAAKEQPVPKEQNVWKRKFRPLPESKAVDLFADVIGDSFILLVAGGLILYEYIRATGKPDVNAEKIAELKEKLADLDRREMELEEAEKKQQTRVETLEQAMEKMRKNSGKKSLSFSS
jgi:hypothetical protein